MEDSLVLAVLQSDIQSALSLLSSGACTNIVTPAGKPLLHLAIALDSETQALAMAQVLLLNGANPDVKDEQGRTAAQVARELGRLEIEKLLLGFSTDGSTYSDDDVAVTFHKYVFEEEEETGEEKKALKGGVHFLEQVASIFQAELEGVRVDEGLQEIKTDMELKTVLAELDSVGFISGGTKVGNSCISTLEREASFRCSTPSRKGVMYPSMDTSQVSTIANYKVVTDLDFIKGRNCAHGDMKSPVMSLKRHGGGKRRVPEVSDLGDGGNESKKRWLKVPDMKNSQNISQLSSIDAQSFHSCNSDIIEKSATMLASSSLLSVCQEFIISDKSEGFTMLEKRLPSLLGVALRDQTLLDQLQAESENVVGERSSLALTGMDSITSAGLCEELARYGEAPPGPITATTRTAYLRRLKKLRLGLVVPAAVLDNKYPTPMAAALKNISTITRPWVKLSTTEQEMADVFNNIPTELADKVNLLTRETVCKASFNYLLLDPRISQNLPMRVFSSSDQELFRTFISAIFYVGKGSRSRPFQHLYEAIKSQKPGSKKKLSDKISKIHDIWEEDKGVVVVQVFQNTIAVEAFTREAAMIDAIGCDNLTNIKGGDYYGEANSWDQEKKLELGTFLVFKAFKIFLQEGERQIRPVDLRSS